jgi:hypothetical protein
MPACLSEPPPSSRVPAERESQRSRRSATMAQEEALHQLLVLVLAIVNPRRRQL